MSFHTRVLTALCAFFIGIGGASVTPAQDAPAAPANTSPSAQSNAPYQDDLIRLSEILGALHFVRNLCTQDSEPEWRALMERLISVESGEDGAMRAALTAAFNRGYRSFSPTNTVCTAQMRVIADQYRAEGATLAKEITARYGN